MEHKLKHFYEPTHFHYDPLTFQTIVVTLLAYYQLDKIYQSISLLESEENKAIFTGHL